MCFAFTHYRHTSSNSYGNCTVDCGPETEALQTFFGVGGIALQPIARMSGPTMFWSTRAKQDPKAWFLMQDAGPKQLRLEIRAYVDLSMFAEPKAHVAKKPLDCCIVCVPTRVMPAIEQSFKSVLVISGIRTPACAESHREVPFGVVGLLAPQRHLGVQKQSSTCFFRSRSSQRVHVVTGA